MYETSLDETWELFADYLDGERAALFLACSSAPLESEARRALENTAASLGYGGCTFLRTGGRRAAADGASGKASDETSCGALDAHALFTAVEGLDPACAVAADADAARLLAAAYRCEIPPDDASRAFGRTVVAFRDFPAMLCDAAHKQAAWRLLKRLPRFGES